ncbi:hypothetical protein D3C81_2040980 [compost metagenome]
MNQGQQTFHLADLFLQVHQRVRLGPHAIPFPGRLMMKQPIAEVSQRSDQIPNMGQYHTRLMRRPRAPEH